MSQPAKGLVVAQLSLLRFLVAGHRCNLDADGVHFVR